MELVPIDKRRAREITLEQFNSVSLFLGSPPPTATEYLLKSSTSKSYFSKRFSCLAFNQPTPPLRLFSRKLLEMCLEASQCPFSGLITGIGFRTIGPDEAMSCTRIGENFGISSFAFQNRCDQTGTLWTRVRNLIGKPMVDLGMRQLSRSPDAVQHRRKKRHKHLRFDTKPQRQMAAQRETEQPDGRGSSCGES